MGCCASAPPEDPWDIVLGQLQGARGELESANASLIRHEHEYRFLQVSVVKQTRLARGLRDDVDGEQETYDIFQEYIAEQDALDLFEASDGWGTNEDKMANVIVCRLKENVSRADKIYQAKQGRTVYDQVKGENKTALGMLTGSVSDFGRFLCYRTMSDVDRDVFLFNKAMSGIGCTDYVLLEILSYSTMDHLKACAARFQEVYEKSLQDTIKSETGGMLKKNYGKWMDNIVEFDRVESDEVEGDPQELAQRLYDAGAGKWVGADEDVYLEILCRANDATCAAIVEAYDGLEKTTQSLFDDIKKKFMGDLEFAYLARVTPQHEFFAWRIYKACVGIGTDEEVIARVLGRLEKEDAAKVEESFNKQFAEEEAPRNDFRELLKSELSGNFLQAILLMLDTNGPKGHSIPETKYAYYAKLHANTIKHKVESAYEQDQALEIAKTPMDGKMQFCGGVDMDLFDKEAEEELDATEPVFEEPSVAEYTKAQFEPSEEDRAAGEDCDLYRDCKKELEKVQEKVKQVESEIQDTEEDLEDLRPKHYRKVHDCSTYDHLLNRLRQDNGAMLEFCAARAADYVKEAADGWGTDEDKLIKTLCCQPKTQLRRVDEIFAEKFGKSLREVTDSELGGVTEGNFKYFMKCLLTKEDDLDAEFIDEAVRGWGTNDNLLVEVVCTRTGAELKAAKKAYEKAQGKSVHEAIAGDTSGGYQKFLVRCVQGRKPEVSRRKAKRHAKEIYETLKADEVDYGLLEDILAPASEEHMELIRESYDKQFTGDLPTAIDRACTAGKIDSEWKRVLKARCFTAEHYYAFALNSAMAGFGTDDKALARIMGRTGKRQLKEISNTYRKLYGKSLTKVIESETSGNFKKAMLFYYNTEAPVGDDDGDKPPAVQRPDSAESGVSGSAIGASAVKLDVQEDWDVQEGAKMGHAAFKWTTGSDDVVSFCVRADLEDADPDMLASLNGKKLCKEEGHEELFGDGENRDKVGAFIKQIAIDFMRDQCTCSEPFDTDMPAPWPAECGGDLAQQLAVWTWDEARVEQWMQEDVGILPEAEPQLFGGKIHGKLLLMKFEEGLFGGVTFDDGQKGQDMVRENLEGQCLSFFDVMADACGGE